MPNELLTAIEAYLNRPEATAYDVLSVIWYLFYENDPIDGVA
jgi:hypothetical protein